MAPKRTGTILARSAVKRPKDPSKAAKREQKRLEEREDEKAWWDRVERFAGKLLEPRVLASIGGGVLGYLAFTPVRFDTLRAFQYKEQEEVYGPDREGYAACVKWVYENVEDEKERKRNIKGCVDYWLDPLRLRGHNQFWQIEFRILCYMHSVLPDLTLDTTNWSLKIPIIGEVDFPDFYWSLRDTLAFNVRINAPPEFIGVGQKEGTALEKAKAKLIKDITLKLQIVGTAGGFAGTLTLPEILKGVGEVLRGVGEIVPG